ncbi:MAG: hypothetical protein KY459_11735 [Acidobacteria bacterium]|nr:hypothetical protein [Acidobacteriota bacterium]
MADTDREYEDFESSAGGLDFDDDEQEAPRRKNRKKSTRDLGGTFAEGGPQAVLEELENMLPESWKEHVSSFPLLSVALGAGVGIFLGMKKGDEIISAGSAMVSTAAAAHIAQMMGNSEDD